ncbi:glycosyltransferase [Halobaculum sp. WSA2]|uniref:Glycosyltransferase n=1 Tax=Halobaculum saliterrae TaxID=2073113 RepID=A0A6B0SPX7_9EURY|nr:glycosyltransferase family 4 protein [Halobaculum saliterrae]MXR40765.1 glycosyltransferase [Halobaculum saliterrae]
MHIAMVTSTSIPPEEGIGYYTYNLSKELKQRDHQVTIVTRGGLRGETKTYDGIKVERVTYVPAYPFHVDLHGAFVNRRLRALDPDIVHTHTPLTPVVDIDTPLVSTIHTSVVEDANETDSLTLGALAHRIVTYVTSKRMIAAQAESATELATVAHSVKDELADHFGLTDVHVVGNGVNISEFDGAEETDEQFGLFVGRLSYRKGIADLIDAWERLPEEQRVPLKIVGKGPLRKQLEERVSGTSLAEDISFLGHLPRADLVRLYQQATLFVVPSHYEGLPTVLLEAMAAKTAVVSTAVSGALDVIKDGKNGVLVPARAPEEMSKAILELLRHPEYRRNLAVRGRETVEREYTWNAVTDRYLDLYEASMNV